MNGLSLQEPPQRSWGFINYAGVRVSWDFGQPTILQEVTTLTITVLHLEFADFVVFWPCLVTNDYLWWPIGWPYRVMRVGGIMGDVIELLGTISWPLQYSYTWDKSFTSNLLICCFFSQFWSQMNVYDGSSGDYMGSWGQGIPWVTS